LPSTYGISTVGLPLNASSRRKEQARELKAYLLIYEQIQGNAFVQIAHTSDWFLLDPGVEHTWIKMLNHGDISGYDELFQESDKTILEVKLTVLMETEPKFLKRRDCFLDHISYYSPLRRAVHRICPATDKLAWAAGGA
jgi:hypothetical protein